jgi:hypothetical protein
VVLTLGSLGVIQIVPPPHRPVDRRSDLAPIQNCTVNSPVSPLDRGKSVNHIYALILPTSEHHLPLPSLNPCSASSGEIRNSACYGSSGLQLEIDWPVCAYYGGLRDVRRKVSWPHGTGAGVAMQSVRRQRNLKLFPIYIWRGMVH